MSISSLGGSSPAFTFLDPDGTGTLAPSGSVFSSSGQLVSESAVETPDEPATSDPSYSTAGLKTSLTLYGSSANLISVNLSNALGETDGTAVMGYVAPAVGADDPTAIDVYDSRSNLVAGFGVQSQGDSFYVENDGAQSTLDATSYLESLGFSSSQLQGAAVAKEAGDAWNSSSTLQSIESALAQYALIEGEDQNSITELTDVYDAKGTYVGSLGGNESTDAFESYSSSGSVGSLSSTIAALGTSLDLQAAEVAQQTSTPTEASIQYDDQLLNVIGTVLLDQAAGQPNAPLYDSNGNLIGLGAGLVGVYDSNGNYIGSIGIDPASGQTASWDAAGLISLSGLPLTNPTQWTASQIQAFTSPDVAEITGEQLSQFDAAQIQAIAPALIPDLQASAIASLDDDQLSALSTQAFDEITPTQFADIDAQNLDEATSAEINGLDAAQLGAIDPHTWGDLNGPTAETLSAAVLSTLSGSELNAIEALLTPEQLNGLSQVQLQALLVQVLSASQISGLNANTIQSFEPSQIATISPTIFASSAATTLLGALTPLQASQVTPTQAAYISTSSATDLSQGDLANFSAQALASLSPLIFAELSAEQVGYLSNVDYLTSAQTSQIASAAAPYLTAEQLNEFSADGLAGLSPSIFSQLSSEQIGALGNVESLTSAQTSQIASTSAPYLTEEQLNNFSADGLAGLSPTIFAQLSVQQVGALYNVQNLTSAQTSQITSAAALYLTKEQLNNFSADGLAGLSPTIFSQLSVQQVAALYNVQDLTSAQTSQITSAAARYLTQEQLNNFSADGLTGLSPNIFAQLSAQQIGELYNVEGLTESQTSEINAVAAPNLTTYQLANLSASALAGLSSEIFAEFTYSQLNALPDLSDVSAAQLEGVSPQDALSLSYAAYESAPASTQGEIALLDGEEIGLADYDGYNPTFWNGATPPSTPSPTPPAASGSSSSGPTLNATGTQATVTNVVGDDSLQTTIYSTNGYTSGDLQQYISNGDWSPLTAQVVTPTTTTNVTYGQDTANGSPTYTSTTVDNETGVTLGYSQDDGTNTVSGAISSGLYTTTTVTVTPDGSTQAASITFSTPNVPGLGLIDDVAETISQLVDAAGETGAEYPGSDTAEVISDVSEIISNIIGEPPDLTTVASAPLTDSNGDDIGTETVAADPNSSSGFSVADVYTTPQNGILSQSQTYQPDGSGYELVQQVENYDDGGMYEADYDQNGSLIDEYFQSSDGTGVTFYYDGNGNLIGEEDGYYGE